MIALREIIKEDADHMLEWMRDPETAGTMQDDLGRLSEAEVRSFCKNAVNAVLLKNPPNIHRAVIDDDDGIYLGTVSLRNIDYKNRNAELGIALRSSARGKRISATETVSSRAAALILDMAFGELSLHRVYVRVLSTNKRAVRFYEKYGFYPEGELRDHLLTKEGFVSIKLFSMIKPR